MSFSQFITNYLYSQVLTTLPKPTKSFTSQTIIVTGSNTGLGLEAARHIVALDASLVILAVRNLDKGEAAKQDILRTTEKPESRIQVWELDLASYKSVLACGERVRRLPRLDAMINNAGVLCHQWELADGMERTISVNVINNVLLALLVIPKLRQSAKQFVTRGKLTFIGSDMHYLAGIPQKNVEGSILKTLNERETADMQNRYPTSKLLIIYAIRHLADQFPINDRHAPEFNPIMNCANPGHAQSSIVRDENVSRMTEMMNRFMLACFGRSTEVGSRALVHAVSSDVSEETHGKFLCNCVVAKNGYSVDSPEGQRAAETFIQELYARLEAFSPGVTQI